MSTETRGVDSRTERVTAAGETEVLIVGTLGGGGIHHYVDEQAVRLPERLSVSVYDMASDSTGSGLAWFLVSILRSLWAAVRFPFRRPPDLVHVHSSHRFSFYRAAFYVLFVKYIWQRPVVFHIHGSSFDDFLATESVPVRWLQTRIFDAVDRVIVLSEYWRELLTEVVEDEKVEVLPNAVDPDEYDPSFGEHPPHIVFVSNLIQRKGVLELVDALEELCETGREFHASIAGKGPHSDRVSALAGRHDNVEYLGYVSESRKRELLETGTIFVLPTYAEGLPIAMLEGMAGGNAIISTAVGSIPEVIREENGILVEPGNAAMLADALEELVASPETAERMGRRNRELIETEYAWDRMTARLARIYTEEVETDRPKAGIVRA